MYINCDHLCWFQTVFKILPNFLVLISNLCIIYKHENSQIYKYTSILYIQERQTTNLELLANNVLPVLIPAAIRVPPSLYLMLLIADWKFRSFRIHFFKVFIYVKVFAKYQANFIVKFINIYTP